jgi:hypothetical protein
MPRGWDGGVNSWPAPVAIGGSRDSSYFDASRESSLASDPRIKNVELIFLILRLRAPLSMAEDIPSCEPSSAWPHQPAAEAGMTALPLTAPVY